MKVFKVTYMAKNLEEFNKAPVALPAWVLAETFHAAYSEACKFQTDNVFVQSIEEQPGLAAVAIPEKTDG